MDKNIVDNQENKEYNRSKSNKSVRPYKPENYLKYRSTRARKINYCQLKGCGRELPRFTIVQHRRFCCEEHAQEYQKEYRKQWRIKNREKVLAHKKKYREKNLISQSNKDNIKTPQSHEASKTKTYLI